MSIEKTSAYLKIKEAYDVQDLLIGKVSYVGKLYLIIKIFDYPCIMQKNEVEPFQIKDYSLYINKDVVVKVTSIVTTNDNGVYIYVSHKIVAEETLELNNISSFESVRRNCTYKGIVKSIKDVGVFVTLGKVDGLVPKSRLPIEYVDNPENFVTLGSVVDVNVIYIDEEKQQLALNIPSIDPTLAEKTKSPFDLFKDSLVPNNTILSGRVVFLEKDCATLHVEYNSNVFTVYVKKEDLAWERIQHSSDAVFLGEELSVRYMYYENGRLYFDLKWQQQDIYPKELFSLDTEELLATMKISFNKFIGKISLLKNKLKPNSEEISGALLSNIITYDEQDKNTIFVDCYTGTNITAFVPAKYAYGLENGKYYQFSLNAASPKKREEEHRPYMFSAVLENAIAIQDPFQELVEKSFKENKTPKSNRESASYLKEIGADMYTDRDRMFYELLQNADDASSQKGVKVMVQTQGEYLIFTHDGLSFSRQDFRSIVSTANSTKRLDRKKTGYKGIGFKSVFTDSERVFIKTGGFFFVFDKKAELFNNFREFYKYVNPLYTEEQLEVFFKENAEYEEEFEKVNHLPWQLLPFWVTRCPENLHGTSFTRNCNVAIALEMGSSTDKYRNIIKGIIQKPRFMLFLRNTQRIQFEDKKWNILSIAKHIDNEKDIVKLKNSFANNDEETSYIVREGSECTVDNNTFKECSIPLYKECKEIAGRGKWYLYQIVDEIKIPVTSIPERIIAADTTTISYAFMLNDSEEAIAIPDKTPSLYAFLPMEDRRYLFPFFINADFELSSNRQEAKRVSVWNEFLFYNIGKNIVSWVATLATQAHPGYLYLLPSEYFTEELEESKTDRLAVRFNRGYKESLSLIPFILNDKGDIVCQSEICIDESGFASIIGADDFCKLYGATKRLLHTSIDAKPLENVEIFSEIEHIPSSSVIESILNKAHRTQILKYWISVSDELRFALLSHIVGMPGNKKNLNDFLTDIPAYSACGKLYSYNKLLKNKKVILRTNAVVGIEQLLTKLGFELTDEVEEEHPFHIRLKEAMVGYSIHLFGIVNERTAAAAGALSAQDKARLFMHFASNKFDIKHEDLCSWQLFCNQNGTLSPLSKLTHIDSTLYNGITKQYVIDENEYVAVGKSLDRYLMKEKDQFDRIVVGNWDSLVGEVGQDVDKAKSLYQLVSTTYTVAEHEQAEEKNSSPLCQKKCVFANDEMREIQNVIVNTLIAANNSVISIVEKITGKNVPSPDILNFITDVPFGFKQQKVETLILDENVSLRFDQMCALLDFCCKNNDTVFKQYMICKTTDCYCFKRLSKNQYVAYTSNSDLISFIEKNCPDIILLQEEFSTYSKADNVLTEESLLLKVLDIIKDVKQHAETLLPIYSKSISSVKVAYINCISSVVLNQDSFIQDSDINFKTLFLASSIEKQEAALFETLRNKIFISLNETTQTLSSIKLQHTIELADQKFPLSKLLPNEDKIAMLVDSLKERLEENRLPQDFIDNLFGEEIDKGRAQEVFTALNKSNVILENGVQLAFVIKYSDMHKPAVSIVCKVYDTATTPLCHSVSNQWYINGLSFMDYGHILNVKYNDAAKYLSIPYKNNSGWSIKNKLDDYSFVKSNLEKDEIFALLDYVLESNDKGISPNAKDLQVIKDRVGIKSIEYVLSPNYCLTSEKLPANVEEWRLISNTTQKDSLLKELFAIHAADSDIVMVRKYLSDNIPLSVSSSNDTTLSQMTCQWIETKRLVLDDIKYSSITDILCDSDYSLQLNRDILAEYENPEHRHMAFGEYYLYLYEGEMPWNACLNNGYVFHTYCEKDIVLDGDNIFVNKNEIRNLPDLIRSIVNTNGFTTEDFLKFFDKYNASISGTLDGENDEDIDEYARAAASQLAKQEAIEWLSSKGYDVSRVQTEYSFINGVRKGDTIYHIVVKSFRSSSKELKVNPNEWLYLLNENSRMMLYMGHMSFAVIDRKSLLGNHDFLRLRISSSNFNVEGSKLEENIERLAKDIQYFERTHFVFERVHDDILSRANSLDDYGLFKSNSNQAYSAGNEEDIE